MSEIKRITANRDVVFRHLFLNYTQHLNQMYHTLNCAEYSHIFILIQGSWHEIFVTFGVNIKVIEQLRTA